MQHLIIRDGANGHNTFAIKGTGSIYNYLIGTTPATVTVPTGAKYAIFTSSGNFFARWDGSAAAVPVANVTDGTGSELNPAVRDVSTQTTFSIVGGAADTHISIAWYK